jgi:hypothetical protein
MEKNPPRIRTRDLPACSIVPQTMQRRAPLLQ